MFIFLKKYKITPAYTRASSLLNPRWCCCHQPFIFSFLYRARVFGVDTLSANINMAKLNTQSGVSTATLRVKKLRTFSWFCLAESIFWLKTAILLHETQNEKLWFLFFFFPPKGIFVSYCCRYKIEKLLYSYYILRSVIFCQRHESYYKKWKGNYMLFPPANASSCEKYEKRKILVIWMMIKGSRKINSGFE